MEIIRSTKKAGVHTNRIDPDPYFSRWESCVPLASLDQPEFIGQPCYQHKTCRHLVKVSHDRIPPIVCPWCNINTRKEQEQIERAERQGVKIFDGPEQKIVPQTETKTVPDAPQSALRLLTLLGLR